MLSNSLIEKDRAHYLHPVVPIRAHEARGVTVAQPGKGRVLTDAEGNEPSRIRHETKRLQSPDL